MNMCYQRGLRNSDHAETTTNAEQSRPPPNARCIDMWSRKNQRLLSTEKIQVSVIMHSTFKNANFKVYDPRRVRSAVTLNLVRGVTAIFESMDYSIFL